MKTPYGKECKYYYADYFRGKSTEECRLIQVNPASESWKPALCSSCPVPDILMANACPNLAVRGYVAKSALGLLRKVKVETACREYRVQVSRPKIGCGHCHEVLDRAKPD
jgi:hypothetical protein